MGKALKFQPFNASTLRFPKPPMNSAQGRILIIRGGAIGDFILTLPVLAALRKQFPETRLEVLGYPHIAQLALAGGLADQVRSVEAGPLAGFFARNGTLDSLLQQYFGSFSIIISYLYDPDGIFQGNVARCSKAQFIAGPHRPDEKAALHATEVFLRPLERLAIFEADPVPRLNIAPIFSGNSGLPILALHPGSGSEHKNWPEAKWSELLQKLARARPVPLLLVGGEAEQERLARLAKILPESRVDLAKNLPLAELAARLAGCAAFVGHDSGITHLAAAVGLPLLVLWGDSVEPVWRPQGGKSTLLKDAKGLREISVARVFNELERLVCVMRD